MHKSVFLTGLLGLMLGNPVYALTYSVFTHNQAIAVSQPVTIKDAYSGWKGRFYGGSYAFADAQSEIGFAINGWALSVQERYHYDLQFNRDTARFYYNIENKIKTDELYQLKLDAQIIQAQGIKFKKAFQYKGFSVTPSIVLYQSDYYQFAKLNGTATDQQGLSFSSELNYYYHKDLILQAPNGRSGTGHSLNLAFAYQTQNWHSVLEISDLYNAWQFNESGFTRGCINLAGRATAVCESGDSNGFAGIEAHSESLPSTIAAELSYLPYQLQANVLSYQDYLRFGVRKDWSSNYGTLGISGYSSKQLGLHAMFKGLYLDLLSDQFSYNKARHLQLQLGWSYSW